MEVKDKVVTAEGLKGAYDNLNGKITQLNSELCTDHIKTQAIELKSSIPYIDFCFNNSSEDFTSRIIEISSGRLQIKGILVNTDDAEYAIKSEIPTNNNQLSNGAGYITSNGSCLNATRLTGGYSFCDDGLKSVNSNNTAWMPVYASSYPGASTKLVKENISEITDDEAKKILELKPIHFDFIKEFGGQKDQIGLIAEEVLEKIPQCVYIPDGYDESDFNIEKGINNKILSLDYSKLTVHLIKMVQILQQEIDDLKTIVNHHDSN